MFPYEINLCCRKQNLRLNNAEQEGFPNRQRKALEGNGRLKTVISIRVDVK